jgi:hypothetical protein
MVVRSRPRLPGRDCISRLSAELGEENGLDGVQPPEGAGHECGLLGRVRGIVGSGPPCEARGPTRQR